MLQIMKDLGVSSIDCAVVNAAANQVKAAVNQAKGAVKKTKKAGSKLAGAFNKVKAARLSKFVKICFFLNVKYKKQRTSSKDLNAARAFRSKPKTLQQEVEYL